MAGICARDAGVAAGLSKSIATQLAIHTAIGSARLVQQSSEELNVLIANVASKKGTTEAALKVFARRHLADILREGVSAAARRSRELSAISHVEAGSAN